MNRSEALIATLKRHLITVATAESLTGGALAAEIVSVPGVSAVFQGGVVAYQNSIKSSVLGVSNELLASKGSVDPDVAGQMALGVCRLTGARLGIATTGAAGPEAHDGKPVGTVYLAVAFDGALSIVEHQFAGDREAIRAAAVNAALQLLGQVVNSPEQSSQESPGNVTGTKQFDG